MFKTDGADEDVDPVVSLVLPNPVPVGTEPTELVIDGSGFSRLSQVRLDGRTVSPFVVGPTQLRVRVTEHNLRPPQRTSLTVVNPGPCAESDPYNLDTIHA